MKIINVGHLGYGMAGQVFHAPIINCISGFKNIIHSNYKPLLE